MREQLNFPVKVFLYAPRQNRDLHSRNDPERSFPHFPGNPRDINLAMKLIGFIQCTIDAIHIMRIQKFHTFLIYDRAQQRLEWINPIILLVGFICPSYTTPKFIVSYKYSGTKDVHCAKTTMYGVMLDKLKGGADTICRHRYIQATQCNA